MAGNELGVILGDAISELQNASTEIEEIVGALFEVDGKTILLSADEDAEAEQPYMSAKELGALITNALSELETVVASIESANDLLRSADGIVFSSDE